MGVTDVRITGDGARGFANYVRSARQAKPDLYLIPFPSNRWQYNFLAALSGARRVLKPGGRLALAAWTGPEDNQWSARPVRELQSRGLIQPPPPDAPGQFTWAPEGVVAAQLEDAGFVEHHVEALDFTIGYASAEDWWESASALSGRLAAALASAPRDVGAEVRAAVLAAAAPFAQPDGTLRVPARTWVAWAGA